MTCAPAAMMLWRAHRWRNALQTLVLLAVMAAFLGGLGYLLWGPEGMEILLWAGGLLVLLGPRLSPGWVLRAYGARPLHPDDQPGLYAQLRALAARAGLAHPPRLYLIASDMANAFAVGQGRQAAIALTTALLRSLDARELRGVLAHEISHIAHRDMWVMGLADLFGRLTMALSWFGQFLLLVNLPLLAMDGDTINWWAIGLLVFAPQVSTLAQLALSRTREYDADLNAARLTGDPEGLARALLKMAHLESRLRQLLWPGRRLPDPSLLRTHPPTEERVRRLRALGLAAAAPVDWQVEAGGLPRAARPPRWHASGLWY